MKSSVSHRQTEDNTLGLTAFFLALLLYGLDRNVSKSCCPSPRNRAQTKNICLAHRLTSSKETVPIARPPLEPVSNFFHLALTRLAKCMSPSFLPPQSLEIHVCVFWLAACICTTKYHSRMLQTARQYVVTGCHSVVTTASDGTGEQAN